MIDSQSDGTFRKDTQMLKSLYMVYDLVAKTVLGGIIQESADPPAIRTFHDALANEQSLLAQHPADFNLILVGTLTDSGTIFSPPDGPATVATGSAWLSSKENSNA